MFLRLIKIYTPFICAITAIIHGVLYLIDVGGVIMYLMGEFTGHSILLILYILSTSRKICKWYKITNYLLLSIHVFNTFYYMDILSDIKILFYTTLLLNVLSVITFLIYRVTAGITKILC